VDLRDAEAEARDARAARRRERLDRNRAFLAGARVAFLWHTAVVSWERRRAETHAAAAQLLKRQIAWKPGG
jgi:hypothetical protein